MAKTKQAKKVDWAEIAQFEKTAAKYQELSRCECPIKSRLNAIIARKYLFWVIDERSGATI